MNIKGKLVVIVGPHPLIRLEVAGKVVWIGTKEEWSMSISRPEQDNDKPSNQRLEKWMELAE